MPLFKGSKNVGRNISTLQGEGKKRDQAIAIALSIAGKARPKKAGGGPAVAGDWESYPDDPDSNWSDRVIIAPLLESVPNAMRDRITRPPPDIAARRDTFDPMDREPPGPGGFGRPGDARISTGAGEIDAAAPYLGALPSLPVGYSEAMRRHRYTPIDDLNPPTGGTHPQAILGGYGADDPMEAWLRIVKSENIDKLSPSQERLLRFQDSYGREGRRGPRKPDEDLFDSPAIVPGTHIPSIEATMMHAWRTDPSPEMYEALKTIVAATGGVDADDKPRRGVRPPWERVPKSYRGFAAGGAAGHRDPAIDTAVRLARGGFARGGELRGAELDMSPADVAPMPRRPLLDYTEDAGHYGVTGKDTYAPIGDLLNNVRDYLAGEHSPSRRERAEALARRVMDRPLAEGLAEQGSLGSELTGIPSLVRGTAKAGDSGLSPTERIRGGVEAASGTLPALAAWGRAAPLFSTPLRAYGTAITPQAVGDISEGLLSSAQAQGADPLLQYRKAVESIQRQVDEQQKTVDDAKARMEANRPKNRAPTEPQKDKKGNVVPGSGDPKFFDAKREYDEAQAALKGLTPQLKTATDDLTKAGKGEINRQGNEYLTNKQKEKGVLGRAWDAIEPYAPWAAGVAAGGAGAYGMGKMTKGLDRYMMGDPDKLLKGKLANKELFERIANLDTYWRKGLPPGGKPPFEHMDTKPFWKTNPNKSVTPANELYPPRSRALDYAMNLIPTGVLAAEGLLGYTWGKDDKNELAAAQAALADLKDPVNIERERKAQANVDRDEFMMRMGGIGALSQFGGGTSAIYGSPALRPSTVSKAVAERSALTKAIKAKGEAKGAKSKKASPEEPLPEPQKPNGSRRGSSGAAALAPPTIAGSTRTSPEPDSSSLGMPEPALPFSTVNDEDMRAEGGSVKGTDVNDKHHSHFQPRDPIGKFSGGPVYPKPVNNKSTAYKSGGSVVTGALEIARRYAHGGKVGALNSPVPGRTDHLPLTVPEGAFVWPADVVSGRGQGNTAAGQKFFDQLEAHVRKSGGGATMARGGSAMAKPRKVDIMAAGGERISPPEVVCALGNGDMEHGHRVCEALLKKFRAEDVRTISNLPGPSR